MKKLMDDEIIQDLSVDLGLNPAFIEKDYYVVLVLQELSGIEEKDFKLLFTGGTCLSKGYGLIKRFSEDIDFIIDTTNDTPAAKKAVRNSIITRVNSINGLDVIEDTISKKNRSSFFSFDVSYDKKFNTGTSIRKNLKLEFTFEKPILKTKNCLIRTIIDENQNKEAEIDVNCLSEVEIAANKLSSFVWRVNARDRTDLLYNPQNDPTIIRHLHDLSALQHRILDSDEFIQTIRTSFDKDNKRRGSDKNLSIQERITSALNKLEEENQFYNKEYTQYVESLSYASQNEGINYDQALASLKTIIDFIHQSEL